MSSKTICFVTTSNTLKYCYKVVFLFQSFLVITVGDWIGLGMMEGGIKKRYVSMKEGGRKKRYVSMKEGR